MTRIRLQGSPNEIAEQFGRRYVVPMIGTAIKTMPEEARYALHQALIAFSVSAMSADLGPGFARIALANLLEVVEEWERDERDKARGGSNETH